MTSLTAALPVTVAAVPAPQARTDPMQVAPVVQPALGAAAVTAVTSGRNIRNDPGKSNEPPGPPKLPAPLKGLGIPPLNTRQVGDFDLIDDPLPPMGLDLSDRLADLEDAPQAGIDLRR
jgi:hypothetical protein